jgi:hypothetical protein
MVSKLNLHLARKSPPSPLFQRGEFTSLWQREVRMDFKKICEYYETINSRHIHYPPGIRKKRSEKIR